MKEVENMEVEIRRWKDLY